MPFVSAISKQNKEIFNQLKRLNKPYVKSIKSSDGDIIDCVKLTDQPAFDHHLLKNHTIQFSPTFDLEWEQRKQTDEKPITQLWQLSGSCPDEAGPLLISRVTPRYCVVNCLVATWPESQTGESYRARDAD
ncbi:hypothetical protein ACFE04_002203 [Oxalis oulophora]